MGDDMRTIGSLDRDVPTLQAKLATTEAALAESRGEVERLRSALGSIAVYDPRPWTGQRINNMPSRAALIAAAYDALEAPHEST